MYGLSLEWQKCPDGVDLIDLGPEVPGETIVQTKPWGWNFRPRSDRRVSVRYEISNLENPIALRFVNARSDEAAAEFLSRFGMLSIDETERDRDSFHHQRMGMHDWLRHATSGEPGVAASAVNSLLSGVTLSPSFDFSAPGGTGHLSLRPRSLAAFMSMEVALAALHDARLAACDHCGKAFLTGPLTGRRSHAKYCSDRCRVAAMRKRNSLS